MEMVWLLKPLTWGLLALGAACLVRANIFGILIDVARVLIPSVTFLLASSLGQGGVATTISIVLAVMLWAVFVGLFFLSRELFSADDILLSLGLQAFVTGMSSFILVSVFESKIISSPINSPENELVAFAWVVLLILIAVYVLSFSLFRVHLAHAYSSKSATGPYPGGTWPFRAIAVALAVICISAGVVATMTIEDPSINQWTDGLGILLFGLAYALRGRAILVLTSGVAIGATHGGMNALAASGFEALPSALLTIGHLLLGALIVALALLMPKLTRMVDGARGRSRAKQ